MRMYRSRSKYRGYRGDKVGYLMPFLIIISIGVVLVLAFNLFKSFFGEDLRKGAYIHIVEGSVQMRTWGTDQFFDLASDALILQGDEIKTSADAKMIVEFFDGTIARVSGGSDVIFTTIADDGDVKNFELLLVDGNLWFNKVYKDVQNTRLVVKTGDIVVNSEEVNIFNVSNEFEDVVRVQFGADLLIEVMDIDGNKAIADETLGVGQMALFNAEALSKYRQFQSPNVVLAIEDNFKATDWYIWNEAEDKSPTQFVKFDGQSAQFLKVEPQVVVPIVATTDENVDSATDADMKPAEVVPTNTVETPLEVVSDTTSGLQKPTILSVANVTQTNADGFYVVKSRVATLTGIVSGAAQMVVNGYTLQKFKADDTTWSYFANADFGLMKAGENVYEVYAVSADGKKSESIFVKVLYEPQEVAQPAPSPSADADDAGNSVDKKPASEEVLTEEVAPL